MTTEERHALKMQQRDEDYKLLIMLPAGQRLFRRMIEDSRLFSTSFNSDPLIMAFNEGQRNIVLRYFSELSNIVPDEIPRLLTPEMPPAGSDDEEEDDRT